MEFNEDFVKEVVKITTVLTPEDRAETLMQTFQLLYTGNEGYVELVGILHKFLIDAKENLARNGFEALAKELTL